MLVPESGEFSLALPYWKYSALFEYAGYYHISVPFQLTAANPGFDAGTLILASNMKVMQGVVVQAEKSYMQFTLDKKIFNVGKYLANAGGNASDILINIPSELDYVQPVGEDGKFETGVRSSFRTMTNDYVVNEQNAVGDFEPLPGLDNVFLYDEKNHALYGIVGNKINKISYQGGVRAEWTDVKTTLEVTKAMNPRKYFNLFPSAHLSYELAKENAIQLSYSRRIRRPFYNDLSPFMTFSDSRNFFQWQPGP